MIKNINSEMFFKIFYTTPSQNLKYLYLNDSGVVTTNDFNSYTTI